MSGQYEVYDEQPGTARPQEAGAEDGPWQILVEYSNQGQAKPPTKVGISDSTFATYQEAMASARATAFEYEPPDPFSPQGRTVYQDGTHGFVTVIEGAMTTFHFSTRLVRLVAAP